MLDQSLINPVIVEALHIGLTHLLTENIIWVKFKKKDGNIRELNGTLIPCLLPEKKIKESSTPRKENVETVTIYEIGNDFRSFRIENLIDSRILSDLESDAVLEAAGIVPDDDAEEFKFGGESEGEDDPTWGLDDVSRK